MYPYLFEIFGLKVFSWGAAMVAGFAVGLFLAMRNRPPWLSQQDIRNIALISMFSLLMGTKLLALAVEGSFSLHTLADVFMPWRRGGISFYPSIALDLCLIILYLKIKKIPIMATFDTLMPYAFLGMAIHRTFGCFFAGCCYGSPTHLPLGVVFHETSRAGCRFPDAALHPTQLYYGLTMFVIFAFLLRRRKQTVFDGGVTTLGLMLLSVSYFFITFLRADIHLNQKIFMLSLSQYMAAFLFVVSSAFYLYLHFKRFNKNEPRTGAQRRKHA